MRKTSGKILTIILTGVIMSSMSGITAFAAEHTDQTELDIIYDTSEESDEPSIGFGGVQRVFTDGAREIEYVINDSKLDQSTLSITAGVWNAEQNDWDFVLPAEECYHIDQEKKTITFHGENIAKYISLEENSEEMEEIRVCFHYLDQNKKEISVYDSVYFANALNVVYECFEPEEIPLGNEREYPGYVKTRYVQNTELPGGHFIGYEIVDCEIKQIPLTGEGDVVKVVNEDFRLNHTLILKAVGRGKAEVTFKYKYADEGDEAYISDGILSETFTITVVESLPKNCWVKVDGEWYYYDRDGIPLTNGWAKDSKGWRYLGDDGKIVTNEWARDSKGWCWLGTDGYWVKNKWIRDNGEWYFIKANGYMAANEWARDSKGWMYMSSSGKITRNKWIKSGGYWYYLKSNGYMATGTLKISGKTYKFDSAGRWVS